MSDMVKDVVSERIEGERPGPVKSLLVAIIVGFAVAALTYRLLRR